jgi:glycosyltransferase involved in cell wall biosynthesis
LANARLLLLDVTRLVWRRWVGRLPTGIDRVCLAYLEQYRGNSQAVIQWRGFRCILPEAVSDRLFDVLLHPPTHVRARLLHLLGRERMRLRGPLPGNGRLYLNVGHTALDDNGYLAWTREVKVRPVYMIHDLIPITHPQFCRAGEAERHARRVGNMLRSAVGIIGNSQATLDSLHAFAISAEMPVPLTLAAPLGTGVGHIIRQAPVPDGRPTFVMLGTIEARKNHLLMLQVWIHLVRTYGDQAPRLLIIGQRGWECDEVFKILDRNNELRGTVVEIGNCSDAEVAEHLRNARALLFPTLAEGYGLPLIEALVSSTPVIASDLPVFHEIGQGVPDFVDPHDASAWFDAIVAYAEGGSPARDAQIARTKAYRAPSWDDHFAKVNAWLEAL